MASNDEKKPGEAGSGRGSRPVTLDLPAQEVHRSEPVDPAPDAPDQDISAERPPADEPAPAEPSITPSALAGGSGPGRNGAPAPAPRTSISFPALLGAALLGALIALAGFWAGTQGGLFADAGETDRVQGLETQLAAVQQQVEQLRTESPAAQSPELAAQVSRLEEAIAQIRSGGVQTGDLDALRQRLDALEGELGGEAAPSALGARLGDLAAQIETLRASGGEGGAELAPLAEQVNQLANRIGTLEGQPAGPAPETQEAIAALQARVDALEAGGATAEQNSEAVNALQDRITEIEGRLAAVQQNADAIGALQGQVGEVRALAERAGPLSQAVAADALADALQSGQPFETELAAIRGTGFADPAIETLASHAQAGIPTLEDLTARFESEVLPAMAPAPEPAPATPAEAAGGVFDRLVSSARGLVEVRPAGAPVASDDIASRIRDALQSGDLAAALAEWRTLPEPAKQQSQAWASDAEAALAASDLATRLRGESLNRLATPS